MKFNVNSTTTISCRTVVEADDEVQAVQIAQERSLMELPAVLGGDEDTEWVVEELDGEVSKAGMVATPHDF